jgi:DNA-binding Lrp family transcriptional regulator
MPAEAYLLIVSSIGAEDRVLEELKKRDSVIRADIVYGNFDICAQVRKDNYNELRDEIEGKIKKMGGINSSLAFLSVAGFTRDDNGGAIDQEYETSKS